MKNDRLKKMRSYIRLHKSVSIDSLCEEMGVSKSTLRRDLQSLADEGFITKVYGGVHLRESSQLIPYEDRGVINSLQKDIIGRTAASMIRDGDVVFIDSGTTTPSILDYLNAKNVTVFTYNITPIVSAYKNPNFTLIVLPGRYYPQTKSFSCRESISFLQNYNIPKAFLAASGFSYQGVTNCASWEYDIKKYVAQNAQQTYLCMDSSKFGITRMMTYAKPELLTGIITECAPDDEMCAFLEDNHIRLILPSDRHYY